MKISFSTNAFTRYPLDKAIEQIASAGYTAVEILADTPHLFPFLKDISIEETLIHLKRFIKDLDIHICALNANTVAGFYGKRFWEPIFEPSLSNPDEKARSWRIEYTKRCLAIAKELGAKVLVINSGRMVPGSPPRIGVNLFASSLEILLPLAEKNDVRLALEYEPGLLIERAEEAEKVISRLESPFLGLNLDIGHSWVAGEDTFTVINQMKEKIFHVHVEDIENRKHYHLIPGHGEMPLKDLIKAFDNIGYRGYLSVELYTYPDNPREAAILALKNLKAMISKGPSHAIH